MEKGCSVNTFNYYQKKVNHSVHKERSTEKSQSYIFVFSVKESCFSLWLISLFQKSNVEMKIKKMCPHDRIAIGTPGTAPADVLLQ